MSSFKRSRMPDSEPAPQPLTEVNFKQRTEAFWTWFGEVAERFHIAVKEQNSKSLTEELSGKINELLPGFAWVFGPGEKEGHYSLTLAGEGIEHRQILAALWLDRAPEIKGWDFYAFRQPSRYPGNFSLNFDDFSVKPIEFWVTPEIDEEEERIDISVWHPLAETSEGPSLETALFLMLDEILGEIGTGRWIGAIEISKKKLAESMPIIELREFVESTSSARNWTLHHPCDTWSGYTIPEDMRGDRPRFDTISGMCRAWKTFLGYLENPEGFQDPFQEMSAEWIYLSYPVEGTASDDALGKREDFADLIERNLVEQQSGIRLGGALGFQRCYIDFLVLDGSRSIELIRAAARETGMPCDTVVGYLSASKSHAGFPLFGP